MTHIHVLDQYQEGDSPVHRLDPRVKLTLTLAFIVAVTAIPHGSWASLLCFLMAVVVIVASSRISPLLIFRRSMVAIPFYMVAATLIFTTEGTPLCTFKVASWTLSITGPGTVAFVSVVSRAWLAVLMATILSATTTFPDLLYAMRALRLPRVMVSTVSFMYRYIFVIADEALRLQRAREARSADPEGQGGASLLWRIKVLGGMIGSLFLRSYARSERIYAAMLARGFDGSIRSLRTEGLRATHLVILAGFLAYLLVVVILSAI